MPRTTHRLRAYLVTLLWFLSLPVALSAAPGDLDSSFGSGGRVVTTFGQDPMLPSARAVAIQADGKVVIVGGAVIRFPAQGGELREVGAMVRYNADGSLDSGFGNGGLVLTPIDLGARNDGFPLPGQWIASALVIQSDGKMVVAGGGNPGRGLFGHQYIPNGVVLARYHTDGSLDQSFADFAFDTYLDDRVVVLPGIRGTVAMGGLCEDVVGLAQQPDGKFVVAVDCGSFGSFNIGRFTADGRPDKNFFNVDRPVLNIGSLFSEDDRMGGVAIQGDGKIVMVGSNSAGNFTLIRVLADGRPDPTFGDVFARVFSTVGIPAPSGTGWGARAVALQPDGKIIAAGLALAFAGPPESPHLSRPGFALARYNTNGSLDTTFGSGGKVATDFGTWAEGLATAVQADGKIVMAGMGCDAVSCERFLLARYNADGTLDASFGTGGKVLTDFTSLLGAGGGALANAVAIQSDGKIVAAGNATAGGAQETTASYAAVARYTNANTPVGTNVTVQAGAAELTFDSVTQAGNTTVTESSTGPTPPDGFRLGDPATYYDISTTATFAGMVEVCISYAGKVFSNEATLQLMHFEPPAWVDRTISLDTTNDIICGLVSSLSPFAIFEPTDTTPPLITASVSPSANAGGWHNSDPTVVWSVEDPESGIASQNGCETITVNSETAATTITCSATNGSGLSSSESIIVKLDKTAPALTCTANPGLLWPPNHKLINIITSVNVEDALSGPAGFVLRSIGSNEADSGLGDGDLAGDMQGWTIGIADVAGKLRAERSGGGTGRQYVLGYEAHDQADNVGSCRAIVSVPPDRR